MLKMYIDNEEVVSKNDFTIKEEMLSASSTILNNTYPKSWELDHDYISRFYYPKDYSKLVLNKETYYPPISGNTIEGSFFQITADTTLEDEYYFKGNTNQNGTPTPSTPIPINVATGLQDVNVVGKNLFEVAPSSTDNYQNTFFIQNIADNNITLIGYGGNTSNFIRLQNFEANGDYTVSYNFTQTYNRLLVRLRNENDSGWLTNSHLTWSGWTYNTTYGAWFKDFSSSNNPIMNITIPNALYWQLGFVNVGTNTNTYSNIMLLKGTYTSSDLPTYEPFLDKKTYSINLGKNLIDIADFNQDLINTYYINTNLNYKIEANTYYTLSFDANSTVEPFQIQVGLYNSGGYYATDIAYKTNNYNGRVYITFSTTQEKIDSFTNNLSARFVRYGTQTTATITISNIQLEKGVNITPYAPYFTPIELNKIGNYQDRIFKSSGKNLLENNNTTQTISGITFTKNDDGSVKLTNTSNAVADYYLKGSASEYVDLGLPSGSYNLSGCINGSGTTYMLYVVQNRNGSLSYLQSINSTGLNITIQNGDTFRIFIRVLSGQTPNTTIFPMLNEGTTSLPYEPYGTNKWYLYKEIDKHLIKPTNGELEVNGIRLQGSSTQKPINAYPELFCNYFGRASDYNHAVGGTSEKRLLGLNSSGQPLCCYGEYTTKQQYLDLFNNNNIYVYYPLYTPTCTEITDTTLINELESIELLNGLNNVSITSANLPMIMNLHYNYQTEHTDIDVIFSGMVKNTNNISLNPREPKYCGLEILDYKTLLSEGKTLDYVISNKTILEAITMVVNSISEYGFELGNVNILNGNEVIGAYSTENKTAYDVLQYLADISGAKWNCRRKDDTSMYIDFYDPTLMPRGTQIDYTTEWAENNNLVDLKFNYGTRDYRNKQIILSDEVEGNIEYNDRLSSDGVSKEYTLPYKIATLNKIEIEGVEQSIATKEEKEVGIYADFYYSRDTDSFTSNKLLPYGTLIDVSYTPIIKGREVVQNDTEIERLSNQLEVNGTISRYENRNDTTDSNKLINIGETYLKYKGEAEITLTIKTYNNNLYNIGQVVYFNAPIPELQRDYLVKSKQIQVISSDEDTLNIFYIFTLSSSFNAEKEINWFDNQRAKTEGNIGEGEFISRNIDINSSANIIWDNLRVEEVSLPTGASNDLQASLEAPLIH